MRSYITLLLAYVLLVTSAFGSYPGETPSFTTVQGGNVKLQSNAIISTDTNGDITLTPNGSGFVRIPTVAPGDSSTKAASTAFVQANGSGIKLWVTAHAYLIGDVVSNSNKIYIANTAHTSSAAFVTDIAFWDQQANNVSDVTGILPLINGGTNKATVASNGAIAYSDNDSIELLAPGTSGQILQTNGVAAPTFVNKSISGKAENLTAQTLEELQVPANLLTETAAGKYLNETGNDNLLVNPSFEGTTFSSGWTSSGCTASAESTIIFHGKKAFKMACSAQALSVSQSSTLYASQYANGVDGIVSAYVWSDNPDVYLCQESAGTLIASSNGTSITNCKKHSGSSKYELLELPVVFGGTSNGLRVVSLTASTAASLAITGNVYVENSTVKVSKNKSSRSSVGPWISFTPTGAWSTNTTYTGRYRQVGENLEAQVKISLSGAPTAATLDLNLPTIAGVAFTIDVTKIPSTTALVERFGGGSLLDVSASTFYPANIVYSTSTTLRVLHHNTSTSYAATATNATTPFTFASGDEITVEYSVPVTQFSGSAETYQKQCNGNECESVLSALVADGAGTTTVTEETPSEWVTGVCTNPGAGSYVCTIAGFTVAPHCWVSTTANVTQNVSSTSSAVTMAFANDLGVATDSSFKLFCKKQGVDYQNTRSIVGTFGEVKTSPGISKPKTCYYDFGGAASTLASPVECSTGTCIEVYDSCGVVSPPSFSSTGTYINLTFANGTFSNSSPLMCKCSPHGAAATNRRHCFNYSDTSDQTWSTNSSGGAILNFYVENEGGTNDNAYVSLECEGSAP